MAELSAIFFTLFIGFPFAILMFAFMLGFLSLAFSIWMIYDCYHREFKDRELWLILLLLGLFLGYGFIASIIYLLVVKVNNTGTINE